MENSVRIRYSVMKENGNRSLMVSMNVSLVQSTPELRIIILNVMLISVINHKLYYCLENAKVADWDKNLMKIKEHVYPALSLEELLVQVDK